MRAWLKSWLIARGSYARASRAWIAVEPRLIRLARAVTGQNRRLAARYLATHQPPKLHIGCGSNELAGWLNTELCPRGGQIFLDATRRFPFEDAVFRFVYSEHMIEHISLRDAGVMLGECFRVMAPGGVIRIVTPDLMALKRVLDAPLTPTLDAYVHYSFDAYKIQAPAADGVYVFNCFMRAWGHQFIHTEPSLRRLLVAAGFDDIRPTPLNDSSHPELRGLAKSDRMPDGFLEMESFVLEGRKPDPRG